MIYVDEIKTYTTEQVKPGARRWGVKWCHILTDHDKDELHAFAQKIGLSKRSFQNRTKFWHYDLTPNLRAKAVAAGAVEIDTKEMARIIIKRENMSLKPEVQKVDNPL